MIKTFDYDTKEGWDAFVRATAGSITDDTFVEPEDAYFEYDDIPSFDNYDNEKSILS